MEHSLEARLWRLVPPPGWRIRLLLLGLALVLIATVGRGMARFGLVPLIAILLWLCLDVLFSASLLHAYRAVARRRRALLQPHPFPRGPRIEWSEGLGQRPEAWCVVAPLAQGFGGRVARTRMILQSLPGLPVSLELTAGAAPSGGGDPVEVPPGSPELRAVVPFGYEAGAAGELLDAYTAQRVRQLAKRAGRAGLRILIARDRVIADVGRVLRRASSIDLLIDTVEMLRDRARDLKMGGAVEFGARPSSVPADAPPSCPVCAAPLAGAALVTCETCRAPHHAECFQFMGKCGVFQCTGEKSQAAAAAQAG